MLSLIESTRENPAKFTCECGRQVHFAIHNDYIEGGCACGKFYTVRMNDGIWNCCSKPMNGCGYGCDKAEEFYSQFNR